MLTVAFVFVAGLGGGLALGKDTPRDIFVALGGEQGNHDSGGGDAPTTTSTATKKSDAPTASSTKKATHSAVQATPAATVLSHPGRGRLAYRGQAVGPAGQPAANLYVYVGMPGARGFEPAGWSIGRTDSRGRFSLDCPHAPILLSPWPHHGRGEDQGAQRAVERDLRRRRDRPAGRRGGALQQGRQAGRDEDRPRVGGRGHGHDAGPVPPGGPEPAPVAAQRPGDLRQGRRTSPTATRSGSAACPPGSTRSTPRATGCESWSAAATPRTRTSPSPASDSRCRPRRRRPHPRTRRPPCPPSLPTVTESGSPPARIRRRRSTP